MKALLPVLLTLALPVQAEIFKCKISEFKTVYQTKPCVGAVNAKKIEIKPRSAEAEAAAVTRLKEWEASNALKQAAEKEALKAEQEEALRQAEIKATQDSAKAQRDLADAQYRQAQALENANKIRSGTLYYPGVLPYQRTLPYQGTQAYPGAFPHQGTPTYQGMPPYPGAIPPHRASPYEGTPPHPETPPHSGMLSHH